MKHEQSAWFCVSLPIRIQGRYPQSCMTTKLPWIGRITVCEICGLRVALMGNTRRVIDVPLWQYSEDQILGSKAGRGKLQSLPRWILSDLFILFLDISRSVEQYCSAARLWCENATLLTDTEWRYKKIPQKEFEKLRPDDFDDLIALEPVRLL